MHNHYQLSLTGVLWLSVFLSPPGQAQDSPHEIFYVPFEESPNAVIARGQAEPYQFKVDKYEEGVVGKAARSEKRYNGLRWDGRGNIDLDRGTMAFFIKFLEEPNAEAWNSFAGVSTEVEGYWAGILEFIGKTNIQRKTSFNFHLFDQGRYTPTLEFEPIYQRWKKDEWHHLAAVWDRNEGVTIYEDGKRIDSNWGKGRWAWSPSPRMLVLGKWIYSTRPLSFDELHIFSEPLTDGQIAQLAKGQKPTGSAIKITEEKDRREHDLARMGWAASDLEQLPVARPGKPLQFSFARIVKSIDAKRLVAQPFEGLTDSTWPLTKYGASSKGRKLELHLARGESFDRARVLSHRRFNGRFLEVVPGVGTRKLLEVDMPRPIWRGQFTEMRTDAQILLERDRGWLGQIDFFRVEESASLPTDLLSYSSVKKLDRLPPTLTGRALLGDTPTRFDNPVQATTEVTAQWKTTSPAFGGFQLLTPTLTEPLAMDGVVVQLVVEGLKQSTPIRITVKEPILPQRDWLVADALLSPDGAGKQTFTFRLKGRPLISYPGREVGVLVTTANPVTWSMGNGGCRLSLCLADRDRILPVAIADQEEFAREAYAETNEGHIWDNVGTQGWGRLFHPAKWLMEFAPEHRTTMQIASRVNWRKEPLPFAEPKNEANAPDWAFWQMQAMKECKKIVHWIIDNRQTENGEFGGVWGDDTDMAEYWSDYALACDDEHKVRDALRLFWDGVYRECLVEGVSRTIRDNLHSYEEGMGTICHQMLVDYGDPVAIEHVMRAASHYPKWMKENEDGSYSFASNYFGVGGVFTEGKHGNDTPGNRLMMYPAAFLTWYNRHPDSAKYIGGWNLQPVGGIVGDAWLRLHLQGDDRMKKYHGLVEKTDGRRDPTGLNALLDETGMQDRWREKLEATARNNPWNFFSGKLPSYAGYSGRMTDYFWLAYTASGNLDYLVQSYKQACMFINNQDWLYTVAQPSTDRIPLPRTTMIRARLGSLAVQRGASGFWWPRHAVTYTKGANDIAALVSDNTDTGFKIRFFSFAKDDHQVQLRTWRLDPGLYEVTLAEDKNNDGAGDATISQEKLDLDRGSFLDLTLPPGQSSVLTVKALKARQRNYDLPDPAISEPELYLEYSDHLHIKVHNVGTQSVKDLVVRVSDGHSGKILGERVIPHIEAPLDLKPRTELVEFTNVNAVSKGHILIELDPDKKHPDLNRFNNSARYRY